MSGTPNYGIHWCVLDRDCRAHDAPSRLYIRFGSKFITIAFPAPWTQLLEKDQDGKYLLDGKRRRRYFEIRERKAA